MRKLLLFMCCALAAGCNRTTEASNTIVLEEPTDTLCSEHIASITYLPLEGSDENIIATPTKIRLAADKILVFSKQKHKIVVYKNDGTFLYAIDRQGRGSQEYMETANFCVSDEYIYIIDNYKKKILRFSLSNGSFVDSKDIAFTAWDMEALRPNTFLFTYLPNNPEVRPTTTQPNSAVWVTDSTFQSIGETYFPYDNDYYEMTGKEVYFTQTEAGIVFQSFQAPGFYLFEKNGKEPEYIDFRSPKPLPKDHSITNSEAYEEEYTFITETPIVGESYIVLSIAHDGYDEPMLYDCRKSSISKNKEEDSHNTLLAPQAIKDGLFYSYLADYDLYEELVSSGFEKASPEIETLLQNGGACLFIYKMK